MPISTEQWRRAHDAVVVDGLAYDEAAERSGVGLSALQKRAAREGWMEARREHEARRATYGAKVLQLKHLLLDKAITTKDAQDVHAWGTVEGKFPEHRYAALAEPEKRGLIQVFLDGQVDYLSQIDATALAALRPHLRGLAEHLLQMRWQVAA